MVTAVTYMAQSDGVVVTAESSCSGGGGHAGGTGSDLQSGWSLIGTSLRTETCWQMHTRKQQHWQLTGSPRAAGKGDLNSTAGK